MNRHVTRVMRLAGATLVATAVAPWIGGAIANADAGSLVSGDPRAIVVDGNIHDSEQLGTACSQLGFADDTEVATEDSSGYDNGGLTVTSDGTYLNLTAVPEGKQVDVVAVKGGDGYNVYKAPLTDFSSLPVNGMHSPMVGAADANVPTISHWVLCLGDAAPPQESVTNPAVSFSNACKTGITVTLSNMNLDDTTNDTVTFTIVTPSGATVHQDVAANQIVKLVYAVTEDTTGTVTVSAPGLSAVHHSFAKNCTQVEGVKHTRPPTKTPVTPKTPTHVKGTKTTRTLPFTGMPTGAASLVAGTMLALGMGLMYAGRRRAAEDKA